MSKEEEELRKILEEPEKRPEEKPAEKPAERPPEKHVEKPFELPPEVRKLPDTVEKLANDFKSFRDSISKTIESLRPEERVPCPGCETPVPKSKLPEIEDRLRKNYTKTERVVERVPEVKVETREVPLKHEHFAEMMEDLTKEKKFSPEQVEAVKKIHDYMAGKEWMK